MDLVYNDAIPYFVSFLTEEGKISIVNGFFTSPEEEPYSFDDLSSQICMIYLKLKPNAPTDATQIYFSDQELRDGNGFELPIAIYTDTLFVNF